MSKCIVLDAGHGRYGNPYPTIDGKYEGTQNFIYAGKLAARLEKAGFTICGTIILKGGAEDGDLRVAYEKLL